MKKPIGPPDLASKRDLILHTYDSFLVCQTRLLVQGLSPGQSVSDEINRRRGLLLLDDLIGFAIAARRLVELTALKSFSNRQHILLAFPDTREEPYTVGKSSKFVGFHTLTNKIIHATTIEHFHEKQSFIEYFSLISPEEKIARILRNVGRRKQQENIEQLLLIASDQDVYLVSITDLIAASISVADKVIEVCSSRQIYLELAYRGGD